MTKSHVLSVIAVLLTALPLLAQGHTPGAHVHGVGSLRVVVDGNALTIVFESPLDNLLGFEHAPRTDKQKAAVRTMTERLNRAGTLFQPSSAAQCTAVSVKLESPVLEPPPKNTTDAAHADLDAEFVFRCEHPEALRDMEIKLFDGFPNLRRLDVQVVSPRGQAATQLSPKQRRVAW